jgi:hypothetical protein
MHLCRLYRWQVGLNPLFRYSNQEKPLYLNHQCSVLDMGKVRMRAVDARRWRRQLVGEAVRVTEQLGVHSDGRHCCLLRE